MASSWFRGLFAKSARPRRPTCRPRLDALEDRVVPTIVWTDKYESDNFGVFGQNAAVARGVIQAAIDDWNKIILDNKLVDGVYDLEVYMAPLDGNQLGGARDILTFNNRPYRGEIRLNSNNIGGYFLDPTPHDHGEFQGTIKTPFTALASDPAAVGKVDLYSLIVHEIGHAVGMTAGFNSELRRLIKDGSRNGVTLVNTGQKDRFGAGNLFLAHGPSGSVLLTGTNLGEVDDPIHAADAQNFGHEFGTYYGTADFMNSSLPSGERQLITNQIALLLKDLYGYKIAEPAAMDSFFAVYDTTKQELTVRGAGDRFRLETAEDGKVEVVVVDDVVSHDNIQVHATASAITVTVTVDTNYPNRGVPGVPGHGAGRRTFTTVFATNGHAPVVKSLRILGRDGDDTISVTGSFPHAKSILIKGEDGNDKISLNASFPAVTTVTIEGNDGNDTVGLKGSLPSTTFVRIEGNDGNDTITSAAVLAAASFFFTPEVLGGDGNDTIDLRSAKGAGFYVAGGVGNDTIQGTGQTDNLNGESGLDTIRGNGGADGIIGGLDRDTLYGGDGDDRLVGGYSSFSNSLDPAGDVLHGDAGNDTLIGDNESNYTEAGLPASAGGADVMHGGLGNDILYGVVGDDRLAGDAGADTLYAGDGNDQLIGGFVFGNAISAPENSADRLFGEAGDDLLCGDSVTRTPQTIPAGGSGGADYLSGGDGKDKLYGQAGPDTLIGDEGNDVLEGGDGGDRLVGDYIYDGSFGPLGTGADVLRGGNGHDVLLGDNGRVAPTLVLHPSEGGNDFLDGGAGHDRLYGQAFDDRLVGGYGNDFLDGGIGSDFMAGGIILVGTLTLPDYGQDRLEGNAGIDVLYGDNVNSQFQPFNGKFQGGNDILLGGDGDDFLLGQAGADQLGGGFGSDTMRGGFGNDILVGGGVVTPFTSLRDISGDVLYGNDGDDRLFGDNVLNPLQLDGSPQGGNDKLYGGAGNDLLFGQAGADLVVGEHGNDQLTGGAGDDVLVGGVVFIPAQTVAPDYGNDLLKGEAGNDRLMGDNVNFMYQPASGGNGGGAISAVPTGSKDTLRGGEGDDVLYGQEGNDLLSGGPGEDDLFGGPGTNTIVEDQFQTP
jgi:Ca2+-binding RTX toxin-like protein